MNRYWNNYNIGNDYMQTIVRKQTNSDVSSNMFVVEYAKKVDHTVFTTGKPVFVKYKNYLITLTNRTKDSLTFQQITGNETDGYRFIQILYKDGNWSVPQDKEITFDEVITTDTGEILTTDTNETINIILK